jgi:RNA-directed DNA polymerase
VENRTLFPTEAGTPQGGIISPTLANLTWTDWNGSSKTFRVKVKGQSPIPKSTSCRYADDFIITGARKSCWKMKSVPGRAVPARAGLAALAREDLHHAYRARVRLPRTKHPQVEWQTAHQTLQEKHACVLGKSAAITFARTNRRTQSGKLDTSTQPVIRGWANYHRHAWRQTFKKVEWDLALPLAMGQTQTSRQNRADGSSSKYWHPLGQGGLRRYRRTDAGRQADLVAAGQSSRNQNPAAPKIKGEANPFDPQLASLL